MEMHFYFLFLFFIDDVVQQRYTNACTEHIGSKCCSSRCHHYNHIFPPFKSYVLIYRLRSRLLRRTVPNKAIYTDIFIDGLTNWVKFWHTVFIFYPFQFDEVASLEADKFDRQCLDVDWHVLIGAICTLYERVLTWLTSLACNRFILASLHHDQSSVLNKKVSKVNCRSAQWF